MFKDMDYICFYFYLIKMFLELDWIKLPPEIDFLAKIKLTQAMTLCYFNLFC